MINIQATAKNFDTTIEQYTPAPSLFLFNKFYIDNYVSTKSVTRVRRNAGFLLGIN